MTAHMWLLSNPNKSNATIKGRVEYTITTGMEWSFEIEVEGTRKKFALKGSEVRYQWLGWIVGIVMAVLGVLILPLSDAGRSMLLYNIKKRTHPLYLGVLILKSLLVCWCYLILAWRLVFSIS